MAKNINSLIGYEDFAKVQMCVGTLIDAKINAKAKKPAYILTIDFGDFGIKTSSAQITKRYTLENLRGQQVIAVINFPVKKVAGINSEVLVLGCVCDDDDVVLLQPNMPVPNGKLVA